MDYDVKHGCKELMAYVAALPDHKRRAWMGAHGALAKGQGRKVKRADEIRPGDIMDNNDAHTPRQVCAVQVIESGQGVRIDCVGHLWYKRDPDDPVCVVPPDAFEGGDV